MESASVFWRQLCATFPFFELRFTAAERRFFFCCLAVSMFWLGSNLIGIKSPQQFLDNLRQVLIGIKSQQFLDNLRHRDVGKLTPSY